MNLFKITFLFGTTENFYLGAFTILLCLTEVTSRAEPFTIQNVRKRS